MDSVVCLDNYKKEVDELSWDQLCGFTYEKEMLENLQVFEDLDYMLCIPTPRIFLFAGPEGYGKHTLAYAFASEQREYGYELFVLDGELLLEEESEAQILKDVFAQLLQYTMPEMEDEEEPPKSRKCYLLIEHFDVLCESEKARKVIARMFKLLNSDETEYLFNACIIVGLAVDAADIPESISAHMNILELQLPKMEERIEYFKNELTFTLEAQKEGQNDVSFIPVDAGVPEYFLAEETNDFSYGEMKKVVSMLTLLYKQKMCHLNKNIFRRIARDICEKKNFLNQDEVKRVIGRMKQLKQRKKEKEITSPSVTQSPQVIYMTAGENGQKPMVNTVPQNGERRSKEFNEQVVDVERFAFLKKEQEITPNQHPSINKQGTTGFSEQRSTMNAQSKVGQVPNRFSNLNIKSSDELDNMYNK